MSARSVARALAPPVLVSLLHRWSGRTLRFAGRPADWHEATLMSGGYDADGILARVVQATRDVVSGRARYERDGVLFDEPDYPFAMLTALLRAAAADNGRLNVIDFGGSLGSTYRQCRPLLDGLTSIGWCVVEQASFVAAGQAEFGTAELRFAGSLHDVPQAEGAPVILASSVLQYLPDPAAVLRDFAASSARHLVVDRTPLSGEPADRLCVQHVPSHIYEASYPCWILSRERLLHGLSRDWRLVCDFPCPEGTARTEDGLPFEFRGLILERQS
ncbi:methyltransferase, TIGR04325 family [Piscinibacter sp. XHJ-5]|uniref:methyltransferase, TIGR04325 family n=1 Tax=Piscinibacter sp. XHJ-5 TaxID=3037797 RepID=UPI002452D4DE|nr:methyltransferase, TIGR04325 family [Piscinibacter sp. XHJ-5]